MGVSEGAAVEGKEVGMREGFRSLEGRIVGNWDVADTEGTSEGLQVKGTGGRVFDGTTVGVKDGNRVTGRFVGTADGVIEGLFAPIKTGGTVDGECDDGLLDGNFITGASLTRVGSAEG